MLRGPLPPGLLLGLTLLLATATLTTATTNDDPNIEIHASQTEYAPTEPVTLTITNNGTTPTQGTPTITIDECSTLLQDKICRDTVHTWTGDEQTLEPGQTLETTWDKTNSENEPANEAYHKATLEWDTPQRTHTTQTNPFYLHEPTTPHPHAPTITIHQPTHASITTTTVPLHITVNAQVPLDTVHLTINDETILTEHGIQTRTHEIQRTHQQAPGAHTLTVQATDTNDHTNHTTLAYTVAPTQRTTSGPLGFNTLDDGGFDDVRIDDVPLFTNVEATTPGALHARTANLGLAFWTHQGTPVTMTLAPGWTTTPQGQGIILEHPDIEQPVIASIGHGTGLTTNTDTLVATLAANDGIIVRPLTDDPNEDLIADAILDGRLGAEIEITPQGPTVFPYTPVNVTTAPGAERVAMIVDAHTQNGLSFVVHLDAETFPYADVHLDGERLSTAQTAQDVLENRANQAFIQENDDTTRVFVSVESFSARDIVIEAAERAGAFVTAGTLIAAGVVVGLAGWGLFRRS